MTVATKKRTHHVWTAAEEELLLNEYDGSAESAEALAKKLDINPDWVRRKANRLLNAEASANEADDNPSLFTVDDICYAWGVPVHKVNTWISSGSLRKERIPGGFVVTRQELKRFFFKFTGELEGWQPKPEILKDIIQSEIKND
jgi:hypothetical protein